MQNTRVLKSRPYLVIPKLIKQPTWGGGYILALKDWGNKCEFNNLKIGQSYELFDKSNLSLLTSSKDPAFIGEVTDSKSVEHDTYVPNSIPISKLTRQIPILLKITQALGNSFQIHVKEEIRNTRWKFKPESWYYFEPGKVTLGVKHGTDWNKYQQVVAEINKKITYIAHDIQSEKISYKAGCKEIVSFIHDNNPWQYVNIVDVPKGAIIDLSPCGIHHSWEEDIKRFPLGNICYEIQRNVMDNDATIRCFDQGKIGTDGTIRALNIDSYFQYIDRSTEANDPKTHMKKSKLIRQTQIYKYEQLSQSKYYTLDKLSFIDNQGIYKESIVTYRHVFVQSGDIILSANNTSLEITKGHSAFIPESVNEYVIQAKNQNAVILLSY